MLANILKWLNNHFIDSWQKGTFETDTTTKLIIDTDELVLGQYVMIRGSRVNDGLYKIVTIAANAYTLDKTLSQDRECDVYGLAIPREIIDVASEFKVGNVQSESLGDYSVTFKELQAQYGERLSQYRKVYSDL